MSFWEQDKTEEWVSTILPSLTEKAQREYIYNIAFLKGMKYIFTLLGLAFLLVFADCLSEKYFLIEEIQNTEGYKTKVMNDAQTENIQYCKSYCLHTVSSGADCMMKCMKELPSPCDASKSP